MTTDQWTVVAAWGLVAATAIGALLFGQVSRETLQRFPRGHVPTQVRVGVALSISGPVAVALLGFLVAALTGAWLPVAVGTFALVLVASAAGWYLAPR